MSTSQSEHIVQGSEKQFYFFLLVINLHMFYAHVQMSCPMNINFLFCNLDAQK